MLTNLATALPCLICKVPEPRIKWGACSLHRRASDLDILTGYHLVDGQERLVVVEGLADGAMGRMQVSLGLTLWYLSPRLRSRL